MWERIGRKLDIWVVTIVGLLSYFVMFVAFSVDMPINMKRGALLVFIPGACLALFDIARTVLKVKRGKIKLWTEESTVPPQFFVLFAWVLGFYAAIYVFGFQIAFILFIVLYLKLRARARWPVVVGLFAVGIGLLYYFGDVLLILWPEGILKPVYNAWIPSNDITKFLGL